VHAPIGERFDAVEGQVADIDQQIGLAHPEPQMGSAYPILLSVR
jgi:hypothetical protein